MPRILKSRSRKTGLPPGSLVYVGDKRTAAPKLTAFKYSPTGYEERELKNVENCAELRDPSAVLWVNLDGVDHVDTVSQLGRQFGIHAMVLEDILNTSQRPKKQLSSDYIFMVAKMLYLDPQRRIQVEQVSIVFGRNFVLSFQEEPDSDVFDRVRESIRKNIGAIRTGGADFLAYALLDSIVDQYFVILEEFGERLEAIEQQVINRPELGSSKAIHGLKRDVLFLRRSIWPLREVATSFERSENPLIRPGSMIYFRDVYDHVIEVIDILELFREMVSSMLELYLSSVNNRINEVMKVLTIVTTIFMPLTLIAGIYGMNFDNMPELHWHFGYVWALGLMLLSALVMVGYFRRRRWL
ncbi:MAG: magnesium/cobalt transporter CorA [Oligoflexia bacterium]|nr:magnesium/cobalt transporter CorA [Oligoflexia bacterium]